MISSTIYIDQYIISNSNRSYRVSSYCRSYCYFSLSFNSGKIILFTGVDFTPFSRHYMTNLLIHKKESFFDGWFPTKVEKAVIG